MKKEKDLDLVILAGGRGKRISKYTNKIPKPLLKVNGIHFIRYLINFYSKFNFKNIYILTGYKGEKFNKFNRKYANVIPIKCIREREKLGTGGALFQIKNFVSKRFILINGDSYINYNFHKFVNIDLKNKKIGRMLMVTNTYSKLNAKLSRLNIKKNGNLEFNGNLMNAGVYLLDRKIFKYLSLNKLSLETDVIPKLIDKNLMSGFYVKDKLLDIGSYSNLKKAKNFFKNLKRNISIFLDRDGVINIDKKHVYKIKDFEFRKNVVKTLKLLNENNINIFIVTNQAGIAKGYFTENDFFKLSNYIKSYLIKKNIYINDLEYCPFHEHGKIKKFKKRSNFRKPGNLMIKKLIENWGVKSKNCFMIGDRVTDELAASKSGIYFEYVEEDLLNQVMRILKKFN